MPGEGKISDHLANERTFLAWVRTSLGIMGFGFVVVKFSLFIKQIALAVREPVNPSHGYSSIMGILLVAFGALIGILSFYRYLAMEKQLSNENYSSPKMLIKLLAAGIVLIGIALVIYLLGSI